MEAYVFVNKRKRERCSARMSEHPFLGYLFVVCVSLCVRKRPAFNAIVVFEHTFIKDRIFACFLLACIVLECRKNDL